MSEFIGRKVAVGLAKEATRGTAVTPAFWVRHLGANFMDQVEKMNNESAMGVVAKINDSATVKEWAEGTIEGKVTVDTFGLILLGMFGTVSSVANGSGYDHTATISESSTPTALTTTIVDPNEDLAHALTTLSSLEVSAEVGDYVKFSANAIAKKGASASSTVAYTDETEFTAAHMSLKLVNEGTAPSTGTAIEVKSAKLNINREVSPYFAFGSTEMNDTNTGAVDVTGEMVLRYTNTDYKDLWRADTKQAMELKMENTNVDLGGGLNPSLTFTLPKVSLSEWSRSDDMDNVIEQTVGFQGQFDATTAKLIEAVLTNGTASY
jgi:hypothetical protein